MKSPTIKLFLAALFLQFLYSCLAAQVAYPALKLPYGAQAVGYEHIQLFDSTRVYDKSMQFDATLGYRPIDISIWYPTEQKANVKPIQIEDYLTILKQEQEWPNLPKEFILEWFGYNNSSQSTENRGYSSHAKLNGPRKKGKYPLIIYCPSYQAPSTENFMLCEFLASQGYVVLAAPSRGAQSIYLNGGTIQNAEAQRQDIEYLLGYAKSLDQVNPDRTFLIGFSFGGLSNSTIPMRNGAIDGMISLDGTVKYNFAELEKSPWYNSSKFKIPFIHFSQKTIPQNILDKQGLDPSINTAFLFYDQLENNIKYEFRMNDLTHGYFSSFGILFSQRDLEQDKSYTAIQAAHEKLCTAVLGSLNYMVRLEEKNMEWNHQNFLSFLQIDPSIVLLEHQIKAGKPNLFSRHIASSRKKNFSNLEAVYQKLKIIDKDYKPREGDLNTLGLQLIFSPETFKSGERIYQFALKLYPNSSNLHDSLAEGYRVNGKKQLAIKHFKLALELFPDNANAKNRLTELETADK